MVQQNMDIFKNKGTSLLNLDTNLRQFFCFIRHGLSTIVSAVNLV